MVGVPWDGGTTKPAGRPPRPAPDARPLDHDAPHPSRHAVAPYELAKCGDLGDAPVNPASLDDSLERIEKFYARSMPPAPCRCRPVAIIWSPCRSCAASPPRMGRAAGCRWAWCIRRPQRHLGYLFRRLQIHSRHALPPRRRGRTALIPSASSRSVSAASLYKRDDNDWAVEQGMRVITIEEYFDLGVDR